MADSDWTPSDHPVVVDPLSFSEEHDMKLMLTLEKLRESTIDLITDFQVLTKEVQRCSKFPAQTRAILKDLRTALERELAAGEATAAEGHVTRVEEEEEEEDSRRTNEEADRKRVAEVLVEDADNDDDQEVQTTPQIKARKTDVQTPPVVPASSRAGEEWYGPEIQQ